MITYPFTEADMQAATDEWGANCGPSALAFACQVHIKEVRGQIPGFEERGYTSPTMMRSGVANMGRRFTQSERGELMLGGSKVGVVNLIRVQWTGPWTSPGANPKWAYRQTHWIAHWRIITEQPGDIIGLKGTIRGPLDMVFDCNGGIMGFMTWQKEIVPLLTATYKRADGGWFPTHVWRLE